MRNSEVVLTVAAGSAAVLSVLVLMQRRHRREPRSRAAGGAGSDGGGDAHTRTRRVGGSSLAVTVLGQGGAPLGDLYVQIPNEQAERALAAAHGAGVTLFDTSPW